MTSRLRNSEADVARRLERRMTGRTTMTMCYLTYEGDEQRERITTHATTKLEAERRSLGEARANTTEELVRLLGGASGTPPRLATDPAAWPGGARRFGETLAIARDVVRNECRRVILIMGSDAEITEVLQGGEDLHGWSSTYDFAAIETQRQHGPPE